MEMRFPSFVIQVPRFYWSLPLAIASVSMILSSIYFLLLAIRPSSWTSVDESIPEFEDRHAFTTIEHEY